MRRIRYQVACSLDGYIAGPDGNTAWIPMDPEIDFAALYDEFDTLLMGRKTYEAISLDDPEYGPLYAGKRLVVISRTLRPEQHPRVTVVSSGVQAYLDRLRLGHGKDIWLFGGGELFRTLLELGYVDTVELAMVPILLGEGIPFLPTPAPRISLELVEQRLYQRSGIVVLSYRIAAQGA